MSDRREVVTAARGDQPLDLAILNTQLVNVLTGETYAADIGVCGERIAIVGPVGKFTFEARRVIDGSGLWATPGFIDGHVHNESSMCTPARWAEVIIPRGTTTVCTDPHEIANVLGMDGVRYMLDASRGLPMRYFVTVPSCVPAVPSLETAGAVFTEAEVEEMLLWERVIAIAEAMDFPGLIAQTGNITPIVQAGHRAEVPIEGHAPGVGDRLLQAYLAAAGPRSSDHEAYSWETMLQKVQAGMMIYARASTFRDGTGEIVKALDCVSDPRMFGMCTDDVMPNHLLVHGHLDHVMRSLINRGVDPLTVVQMATINIAQHYGFWGLGAVTPGWLADIVVLDDLENMQVRHVIVNGQLVVESGQLTRLIVEPVPPLTENSVHLSELTTESFCLEAPVQNGTVTAHAIDVTSLFTQLTTVEVACKKGCVQFPLPDSVSLAAIVPRHGQNTPPSMILISGYPLKEGAIASTVSHDSHNLCVIGRDQRDMFKATLVLAECGGGLVTVKDGEVLSCVPLPIAGLMSPLPVSGIAGQVTALEQSLPELGLPQGFPIHLLALALPVVPEVRLTDKGLVDVVTQQFLPLFP